MTSDTTKADQEAELARQQHIIDEVARAGAEELPLLGGTTVTEEVPQRSLSGRGRRTELAKAEDSSDG